MLGIILLSVIMYNVIMPSDIMQNGIMLSDVMESFIMVSVIILNVIAPITIPEIFKIHKHTSLFIKKTKLRRKSFNALVPGAQITRHLSDCLIKVKCYPCFLGPML